MQESPQIKTNHNESDEAPLDTEGPQDPTKRLFLRRAAQITAAFAAATSGLTTLTDGAEAGSCKRKNKKRCAPNKEPRLSRYKGNKKFEGGSFKITICHPDWDKLRSSASQPKWWDFELGNDRRSVRKVYSKCTTQTVSPGTTIRVAKCTGRGVWTAKAKRPGSVQFR